MRWQEKLLDFFSIKNELRGKSKQYRRLFYFQLVIWLLLLAEMLLARTVFHLTFSWICFALPVLAITALIGDSEKTVSWLGSLGPLFALGVFTVYLLRKLGMM